MPSSPNFEERSFRIGRNLIVIRRHLDGHWLVSKYPIGTADPGYPGYTYSSTQGECPAGPDLEKTIAWIETQPWSAPA